MKVYVLTENFSQYDCGEIGDYVICGVYKDKSKAETNAQLIIDNHCGDCDHLMFCCTNIYNITEMEIE